MAIARGVLRGPERRLSALWNLRVDDSPIVGYLQQSTTKNAFGIIKSNLVPTPTISGKGSLVHQKAMQSGAKILFSNYQTGWVGFN